jgi:dTDP-L-rhamnose 4-epimerase
MGKNSVEAEIVHKARIGDIRHCFCDTAKARDHLDFIAREDFGEGLAELAEWVGGQTAEDRVDEARRQLETRGLVA